MAGKARRIVAGVLIAGVLVVGGALGLNACDSNYPEGVETDAREVRSVSLSGTNYEVVDYEDDLFELPVDSTDVYVLEDSGREFISRDEDTLWIKEQTAERLGIDAAEGA